MARYDEHRCVFCFHVLSNTDICFETADDQGGLEPDQVKYVYQKHLDPMISPEDTACMSRMPIQRYAEGSPEFELDRETGIPIAWRQKDSSGFELRSTRRLCAFCHQPLPYSFGKMPNVTVGLCGNSCSGKTVYMLSLIHDLHELAGQGITAYPDPVFYSKLSTNWQGMYTQMYSGDYSLPMATPDVDILSPLVLNCSCTLGGRTREFSVTLFDMAGEGVNDPTYMAKKAAYLKNAIGVIYLKNPDYYPGMERADMALSEHMNLKTLEDAVLADQDQGRRARFAITMTKFDLLLNRYGGDEWFDKLMGNVFAGDPLTVHANGFNVDKAIAINNRMLKLYDQENTRDQQMRALYARNRKQETTERESGGLFHRLFGKKKEPQEENNHTAKQWAMMFAASPLGRNAVISGNRMDAAPRGMLNVDPLLWLLYCCDLFPECSHDH